MSGDLREQVLQRLPGFAARFSLGPAQVWELDIEEWVVLAVSLDRAIADEERAYREAQNGR